MPIQSTFLLSDCLEIAAALGAEWQTEAGPRGQHAELVRLVRDSTDTLESISVWSDPSGACLIAEVAPEPSSLLKYWPSYAPATITISRRRGPQQAAADIRRKLLKNWPERLAQARTALAETEIKKQAQRERIARIRQAAGGLVDKLWSMYDTVGREVRIAALDPLRGRMQGYIEPCEDAVKMHLSVPPDVAERILTLLKEQFAS